MKILLTAPPSTGKSTVIGKVVAGFPGPKRGIVAREVRDENGRRTGFTSVNEAGQSRQFMFLTETPTSETIGGEFDVDVAAIDEFVVSELREGARNSAQNDSQKEQFLLYVDEIGRAQAKSKPFLDELRKILATCGNVLGSIVYEDEPWSLEFKRSPGVCILEVTATNRDSLPDIILAAFEHENLFVRLLPKQQEQVIAWLRELIQSNQLASAQKLFSNALVYLTAKKIDRVSKESIETGSSFSAQYKVDGQTHKHRISRDVDGRFTCDCDLANGRGLFSGKPGLCSHEMSVRLLELESLEP